MYRIIAALFLLLASAAASSAQGLLPSVWQSGRGSLLKVLGVDPATGNFTGVFISGRRAPVREFPMIWQDVFEALGSCSRRRGTGPQIAE